MPVTELSKMNHNPDKTSLRRKLTNSLSQSHFLNWSNLIIKKRQSSSYSIHLKISTSTIWHSFFWVLWIFIFHGRGGGHHDKIWSKLQLKVLFFEGEHLMMTNIYLSICETFGSRTPSQVNILLHFFTLSLEGWRDFGLNSKSASTFWLRSWIPFSGKNWWHKFSHVMAIFLQQWKTKRVKLTLR